MRILIDTNIFIYREDDRIVSDTLQKLIATMQKSGVSILVHPQSLVDLQQDMDDHRKSIMLSKIRAYPLLEKPPQYEIDATYCSVVGPAKNPNSRIDNAILYSLYKNAVDFLITEDREILKKARNLNVGNRVFLITDALGFMDDYFTKDYVITPPALIQQPVYNLNISDPIFDSLKASYQEFEEWFRKVSREGRNSWVYFRENGTIGALLIYKIEDEPIIAMPILPKKRRLKISSFKVTHVGYKIGELFIKIICDIALQNNIDGIYFTIFPGTDERLIDLVSEYGFLNVGINQRGEHIYQKQIIAKSPDTCGMSPIDVAIRYYPSFYDGTIIRKFIVPILPEYHSRLFTDFYERQLHQIEYAGFLVEGNAIRKAYICHAKSHKMEPGDIVLFYISKKQKLTSLGIVESVDYDLGSSSEILRKVGKRTVYTSQEIDGISSKPTTVILFRHHFHFMHSIGYDKLYSRGVLKGPPQSITRISDENYRILAEMDGIDGRFTIH